MIGLPPGATKYAALPSAEEPRRVFWLKDLARMGLKGVENRLAINGARAFDHLLENRTVAAVDSVKVPDRENGIPDRAGERPDPLEQLQC